MLTIGIDPGLQVTGLAAFHQDRVIDTRSVRGVRGAGNDYALASAVACRTATAVLAWVEEMDPGAIAIETYVDQGKARRMKFAYQTPLVIGAIAHALREVADRIVWQDAAEVLSMKPSGYGLVKYLAEQGRLGHGLSGAVNEHEAAAIAHAMWADAMRRQLTLLASPAI